MMKDAKKKMVQKKPAGAQFQKKPGVPSNQKKPVVKFKREIVGCYRRQTVMKAAQKKIVQKKPAGVQFQKKPVIPSNQKKAVVNIKGGIVGCYRTIAEAHIDGHHTTKSAPTMFMEFDHNKAWLAGELTPHFTCIGGPGRIKQMPCGEVRIYQPSGRHNDCIGSETTIHQSSCFFMSAKVISPVPGTSFQARKTDPDIDSDFDAESEDETLRPAPPTTVVTQKGDIICTFAIGSINQQKKPEVFVHLLRPMLPTTVEILKTQYHMWKSLGSGLLSELVYDMMLVADDRCSRNKLQIHKGHFEC
jgi:hypothetical protein